MKWTNEQLRAINIPVSNLIVSAAAGSGKTSVMTQRIIKRLTEDDYVDIDRLLVVTYTQSAASEIKERIMKRIISLLEKGANDALTKQLLKLPYAHISTIHSFCLDLIKKYFYILNIDPNVKIADESQVNLLKQKAIDKVFENHYDDDLDFLEFIKDYTKRNDDLIKESIVSLYNFARTMPDDKGYILSLTTPYKDCEATTSLLREFSYLALFSVKNIYEEIISLTDNAENVGIKNFVKKEYDYIKASLEITDYETLREFLINMEFDNWRGAKGEKEIKEKCKEKRDKVKQIIKTILEKYLLFSIEDIKKSNLNVIKPLEKIIELTLEFSTEFETLKKEGNLIDFSDFEHMALKLLKNDDGTKSDICKTIQESFDEIYIDEYQDCNNIQEEIFSLISSKDIGKPNVFSVGDMKQSIYRFRDSNPILFRDKCEKYTLYDGENVNCENKIYLSSNFRSRPAVLDFTNSLFEQIMSEKCGELDYGETEKLNYLDNFKKVNDDLDYVDIDIIDKSNSFGHANDKLQNEQLSDIETEAYHIAQKIKNMVDSGYVIYDKEINEKRSVRYSDFTVLLRSIKTLGPIYEKAFTDLGVGVYSDKASAHFEAEEISFLISLLKIIDNIDDDISLVSVMKHDIFSFDENELLKLRLNLPDSSFYECVKYYSENKNDDLALKVKSFLRKIDTYYQKSRFLDTDEFLGYILSDLDFYAYIQTFSQSEQKSLNIRYFLQKARDFEKNNFKGIYSFIRHIEYSLKEKNAESAKVISQSSNVVKIMSIHKSKGLEFPIVFVSGLGRKFNTTDITKSIVMHKDLGIGIESVYRDKHFKIPTAHQSLIKTKISYELMSEEIRVLYVALTRASEKLIITSVVDKGREFINRSIDASLYEKGKVDPYKVYSSNSFIDMIFSAISNSDGYPKEFCRVNNISYPDKAKFKLTLVNACDISGEKVRDEVYNWKDYYDGVYSDYEEIKAHLLYTYPYKESSKIPSNLTVTELKKLANEEGENLFSDVNLKIPQFISSDTQKKGALFGTLIHYVMEKLDFSKVSSKEEIESQIIKLYEEGHILKEDIAVVDADKIKIFFSSQVGKKMIQNKDRLKREFSFKYLDESDKIFDVKTGEQIVIQGTIDAFFEDENGDITIVDYKTDKVISGDKDKIAQRYKVQLDYYAKAVEIIFGKKVKNKILYLFDIDDYICLN